MIAYLVSGSDFLIKNNFNHERSTGQRLLHNAKKENKVDIIYENCTIPYNLVSRPEFMLK